MSPRRPSRQGTDLPFGAVSGSRKYQVHIDSGVQSQVPKDQGSQVLIASNRLLGDDLKLSQPPIFARRNTDLSAEDSSEMAWASVTNIESYLDYAPVGLPQQAAGFLQS